MLKKHKIMPVLTTTFLLKGIAVTIKALSTKGAAVGVTKTIAMGTAKVGAHTIATQGIVGGTTTILSTATYVATNIVPLSITSLCFVGGVKWSADKLRKANTIFRNLNNKEYKKAAWNLVELSEILDKTVDETIDCIGDLLEEKGYHVKESVNTVKNLKEAYGAIKSEL